MTEERKGTGVGAKNSHPRPSQQRICRPIQECANLRPQISSPGCDRVKKLHLNFSEGTALRCIEQIVQSNDIMEAHTHIKVNQDRGEILREELEDARLRTAGVIVKVKHH